MINKSEKRQHGLQRISVYKLKAVKTGHVLYQKNKEKQRNGRDIIEAVSSIFNELDREETVVVYLNSALNPIGIEIVAVGGTSWCCVEIKNIFKGAIISNATSIMLFHNHVSGYEKPSQADLVLTKHISKIGRFLGIKLLDHIILTETTFYSLREKNSECFTVEDKENEIID